MDIRQEKGESRQRLVQCMQILHSISQVHGNAGVSKQLYVNIFFSALDDNQYGVIKTAMITKYINDAAGWLYTMTTMTETIKSFENSLFKHTTNSKSNSNTTFVNNEITMSSSDNNESENDIPINATPSNNSGTTTVNNNNNNNNWRYHGGIGRGDGRGHNYNGGRFINSYDTQP